MSSGCHARHYESKWRPDQTQSVTKMRLVHSPTPKATENMPKTRQKPLINRQRTHKWISNPIIKQYKATVLKFCLQLEEKSFCKGRDKFGFAFGMFKEAHHKRDPIPSLQSAKGTNVTASRDKTEFLADIFDSTYICELVEFDVIEHPTNATLISIINIDNTSVFRCSRAL